MLTTILKSSPKFVVIQDSVSQNASEILKYLISNLLKYESQTPLLYYEFEFNWNLNSCGCLNKTQKFKFIDGFTDDDDSKHAQQLLSIEKKGCAIVIDSLGHFVYKFGINKAYKILDQLKKDKNVNQIITILHKDLFDEDDVVFNYVDNLATLNIDLLPKFLSTNFRASYVYKKPGGKVSAEIEEYYIDNGVMFTKALEKLDALKLVQGDAFNPDDLTTFKISLHGKDIESRNKLVLPYLPKNANDETSGGEIFYEFDEVDDWDEEDPDDDLDL